MPFRLFTCLHKRLRHRRHVGTCRSPPAQSAPRSTRTGPPLPLFFLIDEIFRGTNNRERVIGSRAYVQALAGKWGGHCRRTTWNPSSLHAVPGSRNAHFREDVVDGRMRFDYTSDPDRVRLPMLWRSCGWKACLSPWTLMACPVRHATSTGTALAPPVWRGASSACRACAQSWTIGEHVLPRGTNRVTSACQFFLLPTSFRRFCLLFGAFLFPGRFVAVKRRDGRVSPPTDRWGADLPRGPVGVMTMISSARAHFRSQRYHRRSLPYNTCVQPQVLAGYRWSAYPHRSMWYSCRCFPRSRACSQRDLATGSCLYSWLVRSRRVAVSCLWWQHVSGSREY